MSKAYFSVSLFGLVLFITSFLSFSPSPIVAQVKVTPRIVAKGATTIPVYRFYYPQSVALAGFHVYRTVPDVPGAGWQAEGIAFYVSPVQLPYTVPLYVVYKTGIGAGMDHFYTVDIAARDNCVKNLGYQDQGVFGYVVPKDKDYPGTSSLYRWVGVWKQKEFEYTVISQDHFYQVSSSPVARYSSEGIECNVWTQAINLPHKLFELSAPAAGTTLQVNDNPVLSWKVWSGQGFVRLSYSVNNGGSWRPIGTVPITGNFGDITEQSYNNWKVPADAVGKILIKADWVKASSGPELPWASDTRGPLTVLPAALRVLRRP